MPDRIDELRRQRALVQQHLAWLDREIAAEEGDPTPAAPAPLRSQEKPSAALPIPADTDELLQRYAAEERASPDKVKFGCWVAFTVIFAGFWAAVGVWYLLKIRS